MAGRSLHLTYRPEQIGTRFDDVQGIDAVKAEVIRSLNLFLAHHSFASRWAGLLPGLLFEGLPGTAGPTWPGPWPPSGGPVLFVSATSFQSMYLRATAREIRSHFKGLATYLSGKGGRLRSASSRGDRRHAHRARQAVAEHQVSHSVAQMRRACRPAQWVVTRRTVVHTSVVSEGTGGVVNELLVQMQSFDEPTGFQRFISSIIGRINLLLPAHRQIPRPAAAVGPCC